MVCKNSELKLEKLKETYVTIHEHNLHSLMVEIVKAKDNLNSTCMKSIFSERDAQYNLRSNNHFQLLNIRTAKYGIENIQYIGRHLWASLPDETKDSGTLIYIKQKVQS